jgi:hypothetical protein
MDMINSIWPAYSWQGIKTRSMEQENNYYNNRPVYPFWLMSVKYKCCLYFELFVRRIYLTSEKFVTDDLDSKTCDSMVTKLGLHIVLWRLRLEICAVLGISVNYVINLLDTFSFHRFYSLSSRWHVCQCDRIIHLLLTSLVHTVCVTHVYALIFTFATASSYITLWRANISIAS